jgi:phosphatidylethanolamine/phosphatidyl-N-methylethanolamine N-methyltransferase
MGADLDKDMLAKAYTRWAPFYDYVFGPLFERARRASLQATERIGGRILDVGVGTGISLPDYAKTNRIWGVDVSVPMLRKAQERVATLGLHHVEGLAVMDAAQLAFPDNSFDVVVAQYVVTVVPDPEGTLDEFARVLRPGGEIILLSRVGADAGLRRVVEHSFGPMVQHLGWRLQFPWARYTRWLERSHDIRLVERRPVPPFGHFSLIRFTKVAADDNYYLHASAAE